MKRQLGLQPKQHDEHAFQLRAFVPTPPTVPKTHDRKLGTPWQMLGNDQYGDCAFAAKGHATMLWEHVERRIATVTSAQVVADYLHYTGGPDTGTDPDEMMRQWRQEGAFGTPPITAYLSLSMSKAVVDIPIADYLFGTCFLGVALPKAVQDDDGSWPLPPAGWQTLPAWRPYSWGGHMVMTHGYTTKGCKIVTWGQDEWFVPWEFVRAYLTCAYAVITPAWLNSKQHSPQGLDLSALKTALGKL